MGPVTVVLAPDSFKGSAAAAEVAQALGAGIRRSLPDARLIHAPMADGGEGTLDCVAAACTGRWQTVSLAAIHGERLDAHWYLCDDGLAVVESATVLGLPLIEAASHSPPLRQRGSHALGVLLSAALDAGMRRIAIGLGGSACNDAGLGMLAALGAVARDRFGATVPPTLEGLLALDTLALDALDPRLAGADIRVLCDVDNPLLGARGASRVYGPQKGLSDDEIEAVEAAFGQLAACFGAGDATATPGSGAAGGLGFALASLGGNLCPGADTLMEMTGLGSVLAEADLVITGEGRSDDQTLSGKLPLAIARAAAPTPTVLVSGTITTDARAALARHFVACEALTERAGSVEAALAEPLRWLRAAGAHVGREVPRLLARKS